MNGFVKSLLLVCRGGQIRIISHYASLCLISICYKNYLMARYWRSWRTYYLEDAFFNNCSFSSRTLIYFSANSMYLSL